MRITFVVPFIALTGGIQAVMQWANQLHARGHQVTLVYPRESPYPREVRGEEAGIGRVLRWLRREMRYSALKLLRKKEVDWFDLRAGLIRVPDLSEKYIPRGDVVVAVDWTTAEWVNRYEPRVGAKFYIIQGYEVWSGSKERVDFTWKMPLHKIVVSSWLKEIGEKRLGERTLGPLIYGVDFSQFYPERAFATVGRRRIGMLYHDMALKGVDDGLQAFEIARRSHPDIRLVMYGAEKPRSPLPKDIEYHLRPLEAQLRRIYSSCEIWLCPSWMEGAGMPSMEAMACGCAVVTTDVGAVRDYAVPGETVLVSPPRDPEALARNLLRLLDDETELRRIAEAGYRRIQQFTWERSAEQLERYFLEVLRGAPQLHG